MVIATLAMGAVGVAGIELFDHQIKAIEKLRSGSILRGGVGSGKSITALAYYFVKECGGEIDAFHEMKKPKDLYIITTAKKRDDLDWEGECCYFLLTPNKDDDDKPKLIIDSWNNIKKYNSVKNAFFIFDEQRLIGNGVWVETFLNIAKVNNWILLTATPGDTWLDYIPVFIANGFYKHRTEFNRRHVVYNPFTKYSKVDRYLEVSRLIKLRDQITVSMHYNRKTVRHDKTIMADYDKSLLNIITDDRWNIYKERPIKTISELCYLMRKVVNSDQSRIQAVSDLLRKHPKIIIFYNFNYELDMLLSLGLDLDIRVSQWNGHKHEPVPNTDQWLYLVQYAAGAEAWNCIETDTIIFYSQNYSYKTLQQASGRIDRLNTPFTDLYYYHIRSEAPIDIAIQKALKNKSKFNELKFIDA